MGVLKDRGRVLIKQRGKIIVVDYIERMIEKQTEGLFLH